MRKGQEVKLILRKQKWRLLTTVFLSEGRVGPVTCVLITQLVRCTGTFENHCVQFSKHAAGEYPLGVSELSRQHCIPIKSGSFGVGMRSPFCFQFSR